MLIKPLLGHIEVINGALDADSKPAANNTRWIFDVEGAPPSGSFKIRLLDNRARRPLALDLFACVMTAKSDAFYAAKPHFRVEDGVLVIRHAEPPACSYRVMLDVMHSATR
jgi:hypothetical protein